MIQLLINYNSADKLMRPYNPFLLNVGAEVKYLFTGFSWFVKVTLKICAKHGGNDLYLRTTYFLFVQRFGHHLLTSALRVFISRTRIGTSVTIFSASKDIMVSISRSMPHTCWISWYWGCLANHSFSFIRVISASQSFSFGSVPSLPGLLRGNKENNNLSCLCYWVKDLNTKL